MAKVYVVQEVANRNVLPAQQYGELTLMLPPGDVVLSAAPTVKRLRRHLKDYTDQDFILTMGDPIAIALAGAIASESNAGKVNFLKWDRQEKRYYPIEIDLYGTGAKNDD